MLRIADISKRYRRPEGDVQALDRVTVDVGAGEFVAVQGQSGSGKTTLLLAAGGLLVPGSGTVVVGGCNLYALSPDQRARVRGETIGFVFQQFHLIPYLSVLRNVLAPSVAVRRPQTRDRARELLARFNLTDRMQHVPAELSTGERQRTALARALLNRPKLLLADEPTGNLDGDNAEVVLRCLDEFARSGGAVLLVTHDTRAAQRARRSIRLAAGKVIEDAQE
jgi:ABC-type lipoprotein export system ATPase subunit